jgi:NMD protein affecting ribosome stability and mRNA decay
MIIICALCGKPEEHRARGLSRRCYQKLQRRGELQRYPDRRATFLALYQQRKKATA